MKLSLILENIVLSEASVEQLRKAYSNVPDDVFNKIKEADPTGGKYLSWLLSIYQLGNLKLEDLYKATEYLNVYDVYKKRNKIPSQYKDLNKSKKEKIKYIDDYDGKEKEKIIKKPLVSSLQDLFDIIEPFYEQEKAPDDVDLSRKEKLDKYNMIFEGDVFKAYVPKTYEASCSLGSGTQWCTATNNTDEFYNYYTKYGNLLIFINKTNQKEKYQLFWADENRVDAYSEMPEPYQFRDKNDNPAPLVNIISKDIKLYNFLMEKYNEFYNAIEESIDDFVGYVSGSWVNLIDYKEDLFDFLESMEKLGRLPLYQGFFMDKQTLIDVSVGDNKATLLVTPKTYDKRKLNFDNHRPLTELLTTYDTLKLALVKQGWVFYDQNPIYIIQNKKYKKRVVSYDHKINFFASRLGTPFMYSEISITDNSRKINPTLDDDEIIGIKTIEKEIGKIAKKYPIIRSTLRVADYRAFIGENKKINLTNILNEQLKEGKYDLEENEIAHDIFTEILRILRHEWQNPKFERILGSINTNYGKVNSDMLWLSINGYWENSIYTKKHENIKFLLGFIKSERTELSAFYHERKIVFRIPKNAFKETIENLPFVFMINKEVFIHEFTHLLDFKKFRNVREWPNDKGTYKSKNEYGVDQYLEQTIEYNAIFKEVLSKVLDYIYDEFNNLINPEKNYWKLRKEISPKLTAEKFLKQEIISLKSKQAFVEHILYSLKSTRIKFGTKKEIPLRDKKKIVKRASLIYDELMEKLIAKLEKNG